MTRWLAAHRHPHTQKLPLMNPVHVLIIVLSYLAIVFLGKLVMRPFPAFKVPFARKRYRGRFMWSSSQTHG